jgi:hypothetical protein
MDRARNWYGPVAGFLFALAMFAAVAVGGSVGTDPEDPKRAVLAEFRDKADDIQVATLLTALGLAMFLVFVGHLRKKLHDGGAGGSADGFLAGGIAVVAATLVIEAFELTGRVAGEGGHAEVAQMASDFLWESTWLFTPGLLAVGFTAAVAIFTTGVLPRWLGGFAVVVALGGLAPWMGIFVLVLWVLAVSVVELIRPRTDLAAA